MIISHIIGGLGNQMFQYAAGRSLSEHLQVRHAMDIRDFGEYSLHNGFELGVFNFSVQLASPNEIRSVLGVVGKPIIKKLLRREIFEFLRPNSFIVEPHFNFFSEFFSINSNSYLYGYWQSEKYFKRAEQLIRKDFSFKVPLIGKNKLISSQIANSNAVSIHIRRGDYVSDAKTSKIMNICDKRYYEKAIAYISSKIDNAVFYVFSDDLDWARQNIVFPHPCLFIDHNRNENSHFDMHLMSLCKHHIIANSSFSWWGAWLNRSVDKIVVAPKCWFVNGNDDSDLIPCDWIRL